MSQHYDTIGRALGLLLGLHMRPTVLYGSLAHELLLQLELEGPTARAEDLCASLEPDGLTEVDAGVL